MYLQKKQNKYVTFSIAHKTQKNQHNSTAVRNEHRQTDSPTAETWPGSCSHVVWPPSWPCPIERESQLVEQNAWAWQSPPPLAGATAEQVLHPSSQLAFRTSLDLLSSWP